MLKPYDKQEDVPEALREHYSKREDGKWHADIPDDHPAVKHNAKLLSEKQTAESRVTQLTSDLESARAGNLGRGQVAMAKADAARLEEFDALKVPIADIKTKLAEHETLKADVAKHQRDSQLRAMAKDLGYDNVEAFVRLPALPDFERREKDGKPDWIAKLKDDKGVITEKPAKEFIESSADIQPFLPALKAESGVKLHTSSAGAGSQGVDPFAWARDFGKQWNEQNKPAGDVMTDFGMAKSA